MPAPIDLSQTPARTAPPKGIFGGNPKSRGTGLAIDEYARKVLWIGIFASLLIVGYLLAGLFTGAWDKTAMTALPHADRLRQMQNIDFAFRTLQITALVAVVSLLICCLRDESIGYVLVGVGLVFYAGLPFLTAQVYQFRVFKTSVATAVVLADFQILAWIFFIPGVIWTFGDLIRRFRDAADAAAVQRANLKYGATVKKQVVQQRFLGRCWELPYCRENIRQKCPVYIKRRGPCWWHKEGCMCEERIILQAVITSDWKQKAAQADMAYNFGNKRVPLSPAALRQRCRTCVIYNEHQRQKYKAMVAVALVLVPVLLYLNAPLLQSGTVHILAAMEAVMNRFSYDNSTTGISFLHGRPSVPIEWTLIGAICVMILSQVLRFIEFWCFKLKI